MERMKLVIAIVSVLMISLLTACGDLSKDHVNQGNGTLVEYEEGGVLYIQVSMYSSTPYYSPNGKLCHYVDGEIVEIEQEDQND